MAYAYHLYDTPGSPRPAGLTPLLVGTTDVLSALSTKSLYRHQLLPFLSTLRALHPRHIPVLLLLACTLHALGDYQTAINLNYEILTIDPGCVEAMSNLGTTLKALGQEDQAYEWWLNALRIRPTYWDAVVSQTHVRLPSDISSHLIRRTTSSASSSTLRRTHLTTITALKLTHRRCACANPLSCKSYRTTAV